MAFELVLPFLRPIAHLITDPDVSEVMVNGLTGVLKLRCGDDDTASTSGALSLALSRSLMPSLTRSNTLLQPAQRSIMNQPMIVVLPRGSARS